MIHEHLAAACGLYCGACVIYRACRDNNQKRLEEFFPDISSQRGVPQDNLYCDGCLSGGRLTEYCQQCPIRLCPGNKSGVSRCSECPDFPCSLITDFNNDGIRHHAEVLDNIRRMREIGVANWVIEKDRRWRCPQCGAPVEWYARPCFQCGAPQPRRLPSLPKDQK